MVRVAGSGVVRVPRVRSRETAPDPPGPQPGWSVWKWSSCDCSQVERDCVWRTSWRRPGGRQHVEEEAVAREA